ncbi:uncharacterized protein NECHADRAFT_87144 [Fusarium vanettenii 77-13-4]|uniref:Uncharacterized protein n=1 Tax=Fusarium vanettenii (strain ATCC MYA-4622 / CBS 123669 / FGSC 9596 / NRRL 45880 / 77-13-4) TaxID=660122 RepID=C7ZIH5_FUSV7|nr:uncharacterized protein NECHADRAFT_87144 [Fusarium vanettenii 77-13-4]EEU36203.1 predicted protein [Fusarium vanettenii 77-13-4]
MVAPIPVIGFMIAGALISKTVDVAIPYIAEQAKGWRWGWAREPQIPAYLRGKVNTVVVAHRVAPRLQICAAYEALFALHPENHASPPLLYTLLSVPLPSHNAGAVARLDHMIAILHQLDAKMAPYFETKDNTFRGSELRSQAQMAIDTWILVGSILLDERVKAEYDTIVVRPTVLEGKTVKEVLLDDELCGKKWGDSSTGS